MAWHGGRFGRRSRPRRPWRTVADALIVLILAAGVIIALERWPGPQGLIGVTVVDGDSLRDATHEIRLYGIDAPELAQDCEDERGRSYPCGREAKAHLARLVVDAPTCRGIETDRYGRLIAVCESGGRELNRTMVEDGLAIAYLTHSLDYVIAEAAARRARRGIWRGRFEAPQAWRDRHRKATSRAEAASTDEPPPD